MFALVSWQGGIEPMTYQGMKQEETTRAIAHLSLMQQNFSSKCAIHYSEANCKSKSDCEASFTNRQNATANMLLSKCNWVIITTSDYRSTVLSETKAYDRKARDEKGVKGLTNFDENGEEAISSNNNGISFQEDLPDAAQPNNSGDQADKSSSPPACKAKDPEYRHQYHAARHPNP
jgi:hypothetical protein